ncbi:MAG: hypothetical protein DRQ13_13020 [Ignavibacteriae bacterium]|nr:MAG: hypothetical protein DRQ13_13020 [Ignavibacteriota bacterium]
MGLDVAKFLAAEGISVEAIDVRFIKPIPSEVVDAIKRSDHQELEKVVGTQKAKLIKNYFNNT